MNERTIGFIGLCVSVLWLITLIPRAIIFGRTLDIGIIDYVGVIGMIVAGIVNLRSRKRISKKQ